MERSQLLVVAALFAFPVLIRIAAPERPSPEEPHRVDAPRAGAGAPTPGDLPPEVATFLRAGQNWRAARRMRVYLGGRESPAPGAVLLAARAEA
ncbi:MAG TPA: hypothetical protein VHG28_16755, partial [Longimicrobiaceae bacterium]|nr:hypothetical protein [Longimicrobiaceae bacterium]